MPVRSLPSEPTAMWKRPVLGAVQSVRKTFFPAAPALAVPLITFPFSSLMPRIFRPVAWSLSGRLFLVLSLTVYSSPPSRSTPIQSSSRLESQLSPRTWCISGRVTLLLPQSVPVSRT